MTDTSNTTDSRVQIAVIAAIVAVLLNVAFIFLSTMYFDDRTKMHGATSAEHITSVRIAFAVFTAAVVAGIAAIQFAPRHVGHTIPMASATVAILVVIMSWNHGYPLVLPVTLVVYAVVVAALVQRSYFARSRPAWSFLLAICAVGGVVTLFAATKIRNAVGIQLFYAMIIPGLMVVAAVGLSMLAPQYTDTDEPA